MYNIVCTIILMNKFIFVKRMGQYSASANTAGENLVAKRRLLLH